MLEQFYLKIVLTLTIGFGLAAIFGYITHRLKLSPICGYLIAGYFIGPFSPGPVGDLKVSEQLAEIGVILMMFGVGLHLGEPKQRLLEVVVEPVHENKGFVLFPLSFAWRSDSFAKLGFAQCGLIHYGKAAPGIGSSGRHFDIAGLVVRGH